MINWQENVHKPFLISAASEKPIVAGDTFYSVLSFEKAEFVRRDFREEEWEHVDPNSYLSWWKQVLPHVKDDKKQQLLNATVLLEIFNDIKQSTSRHEQCFLYCLALLLMRLKKLRYLDLTHEENEDFILLQDRSDKSCYKIRDPKMSSDEEELMSKNLESIFTLNTETPESAATTDTEKSSDSSEQQESA